jgi:hypothetical protein
VNFLLNVASSCDLLESPELVYVVLDLRDRKKLLKRRKMFQAVRAYDLELTTMEYNDQVEWYRLHEADSKLLDRVCDEHVVKDAVPPRRATQVRVECQSMQLDDSGVYWDCLIKHTEVRLVSAVIPWDLLTEEK